MPSLNTRVCKLEQSILESCLSPAITNLEIIARLRYDPTNPTLRRLAMQRLESLVSDQSPDDPRRPCSEAIMIGGLLDADLEQWAVNEKHREIIHLHYTAI